MNGPRREVIIDIKPGQRAAASVAIERWTAAEKLASGFNVFGDRIKAYLLAVWVVDGPRAGTWHNDRERALKLFRQHVPTELVTSVIFEGRDWNG